MKKYLKPEIEIINTQELMCTCGCGSWCTQDCQCHNGYHGHNPHECSCYDHNGHGYHPENAKEMEFEDNMENQSIW